MVPTGEKEPEPSKKAVRPSMDAVKEAVGAWSGVTETPYGEGETATAWDC